MNRKRSHWLAIGLLLAAAMMSGVLGIAACASLPSAAAGDLAVGSTASTGNLLAIVLGTAVLVALELARTVARRSNQARRAVRAAHA